MSPKTCQYIVKVYKHFPMYTIFARLQLIKERVSWIRKQTVSCRSLIQSLKMKTYEIINQSETRHGPSYYRTLPLEYLIETTKPK